MAQVCLTHPVIKSGVCGVAGCRVQHAVTARPIGYWWTGYQQYVGTHHGRRFVYEIYMLDLAP
jgi:hypothetical protein